MTGAREKLLRHVHGWRKHKKELVLSPTDEKVASSIKHTQFKTKTAKKPYPLAPHIPI